VSHYRHASSAAAGAVRTRRRDTLTERLRLAVVRPDWELLPLNGTRLSTPGHARPDVAAPISAVSFRAELRPTTQEVLQHLLDPAGSVVARSRLTAGHSPDEFEAEGAEHSNWSMASAVAAAARFLGRPIHESGCGALVQAVRDDVAGLFCGDIVTAVDGRPVDTAASLRAALLDRYVASLTVTREVATGAGPRVHDVRIPRRLDATWGIRVATAGRVLRHGIDAQFRLPDDLRGPSLGLACALSVVDAFTDGQLAAGGPIVATGTVDLDGHVGAVGAIEFKARSVRAQSDVSRFLVPADPSCDVRAATRILAGNTQVVAVSTLAEAVQLLRAAR
jgi:PDZ domain-containing secreted protein